MTRSGAVILFILIFTGRYNIKGIPLLLLTFGFAIGYEYFLVRPVAARDKVKNIKPEPSYVDELEKKLKDNKVETKEI